MEFDLTLAALEFPAVDLDEILVEIIGMYNALLDEEAALDDQIDLTMAEMATERTEVLAAQAFARAELAAERAVGEVEAEAQLEDDIATTQAGVLLARADFAEARTTAQTDAAARRATFVALLDSLRAENDEAFADSVAQAIAKRISKQMLKTEAQGDKATFTSDLVHAARRSQGWLEIWDERKDAVLNGLVNYINPANLPRNLKNLIDSKLKDLGETYEQLDQLANNEGATG